MMSKKRLSSVTNVPLLLVLSVVYGITRLSSLLLLPLFTDESIYLYWAKVIATTHAQWFISLTDGKPPLLIWLIATLLSIFPQDWYLLAGRLPSVATGLVALIAIYKLAELLFASRRSAVIAAVLYILFPMTLFYDRMALFDSMLNAMLLVTVYFAVLTGRTNRLFYALCWGVSLGLAFLSKPTALLFLPLTILAAFSQFKRPWTMQGKKAGLLSLLAVGISEVMNNLQRVSSAYPAMLRKNQQFQQPIAELISHPFALTLGNLKGILSWTVEYYTWPFFLLGLAVCVYGLFKRNVAVALLSLLWFVPLFMLATVGREIFPRYILIVVPYFLLIVSYGVDRLLTTTPPFRYVFSLLLLGVLSPILYFDYFLLISPEKAPLPVSEANQYVFEHPAGYGLEETYAFLRKQSAKQDITVVTQGTFGLYPYAFYLEFWGNPRVKILPKWPLETIDQEIYAATKKRKVYIILKEYDKIPKNLPIHLVFSATKPGGRYPILVTELNE